MAQYSNNRKVHSFEHFNKHDKFISPLKLYSTLLAQTKIQQNELAFFFYVFFVISSRSDLDVQIRCAVGCLLHSNADYICSKIRAHTRRCRSARCAFSMRVLFFLRCTASNLLIRFAQQICIQSKRPLILLHIESALICSRRFIAHQLCTSKTRFLSVRFVVTKCKKKPV